MRFPRFPGAALLVSLMAVALAGCGGDNPVATDALPGYGTVSVLLTDGPIDLSEITSLFVTFDSLYVMPAPDSLVAPGEADHRRPIKVITAPITFDLLSLTNGLTAALGTAGLPEGNYRAVRLALDPAGCWLVEADGDTQDVIVPSRHLTIITDFSVVAGQVTELVLDFDTAASLVKTGDGVYILRPVVRQLPDGVLAASIEGQVWVQTPGGLVSAGDFIVPNPRFGRNGHDQGQGGRPPDHRWPGNRPAPRDSVPLTVAWPMIVHARAAGDSTDDNAGWPGSIAGGVSALEASNPLPPGDPRFHQPHPRGTVVGPGGHYILWRLRKDATYDLRLFIHPRAGFVVVSGPGPVTLTGDAVGQDFVIAPAPESVSSTMP